MKKDIGVCLPVYPAPALVVGAYDEQGQACGLMVAWGGVCCSEPPCIAVGVEKSRHTLGGMDLRKAFTVNISSEKYIAEADYFGLVSGKDREKFTESGLTPRRGELVDAPYIEEFPVSFECEVVHRADLGSHILLVGKVVKAWAHEECLDEKGYPDPLKVRPLIFAPRCGTYYSLGDEVGKAYSAGKKFLKSRE